MTAVESEIPAGAWVLDPIHSSATFAVTYNAVGAFRCGFREFWVRLDGGAAPGLEGAADTRSIAVEEPQLRGHLLSPDFFDTVLYHEIKFCSEQIAVGGRRVEIEGLLKINDRCRRVRASGTVDHIAADRHGLEGLAIVLDAAIDRRDFEMDFNAPLPGGGLLLGWGIEIAVNMLLVRDWEL